MDGGVGTIVEGRPEATSDSHIITIDAAEIRPSRTVSRCTRVTSLEDNLIERISTKCEISKSSFVRAAIIFAMEYVLRDLRDGHSLDSRLSTLFMEYDSEISKVIEECREKIRSGMIDLSSSRG